jgi:hypothetical protein
VLVSEEELVEIALLKYAQQEATKWGAERFAAEFERRDLEERWLEAARSHTSPYAHAAIAAEAPPPDMLSGPVDAAAQDHVVGSDRGLHLMRPKYERHSSVPRPPVQEHEPERRRGRGRRRQPPTEGPGWLITPAEAARMSAASRRLYGLEPMPDRVG